MDLDKYEKQKKKKFKRISKSVAKFFNSFPCTSSLFIIKTSEFPTMICLTQGMSALKHYSMGTTAERSLSYAYQLPPSANL